MTPGPEPLPGFTAWYRGLARRRHRVLLLLTGERQNCWRKVAELAGCWPGVGPASAVWLGGEVDGSSRHRANPADPDSPGDPERCCSESWDDLGLAEYFQRLAPRQARTLPGRQLRLAVIDSWCGLSPDGLGAIGGCLEGGGALVLLAPPREQWGRHPDPDCARHCPWPYGPGDYAGRFWRHLDRSLRGPGVVELSADQPWSVAWPAVECTAGFTGGVTAGPTDEQQAAVAAIERLAAGRARRPLVLIAHRGRGKSAALGLAAGRLLRSGRISEVVVTAARRSALDTFFEYAGLAWPEARRCGDVLWVEPDPADAAALVRRLRFLPPDQVPVKTPANTAPAGTAWTAAAGMDPAWASASPPLLLVDEAAALPAIVLRRLLQAPRIVFATTVHGYEGSGRGFDLRFTRELDRATPRWRRLELTQPLRWASDDPLEPLLFRALLLDAEPGDPLESAQPLHCRLLDRDRLVDDEPLLRSLFGLLVAAHYRTAPDDLRELLDAPHIRVWAAMQGESGPLVGAALVAAEGGLPGELARAVRQGRRRVRGHLLAQSLAFHGGWPMAAEQRGARVVRIAIHPAMRRRGLGRRLLDAIAADESRRGGQWLGASFALDPEVIGFWQRAGFVALRLGVRREAASGERALQVIKRLSVRAGEDWIPAARDGFLRDLPLLLADVWRDLDPDLVPPLLAGGARIHGAPDGEAREDLQAFIQGRPLPTCLPALTALARHLLSTCPEQYAADQRAALVLRLVQLQPDPAVIAQLRLTGSAQLLELLTTVVRQWLSEP